MKNLTFSILFILLSLSSYSQDLSGTYTDGENQITFNNGSVEFSLLTGGAFIMEVKAKGIYYFIDDFLIIETKNFNNNPSNVIISKSLNDSSFLFTVDNLSNEKAPFVSVCFLDSLKNIITKSYTNINGKCYVPQNSTINTIETTFVGYFTITTNYQLDKDYNFLMSSRNHLDDSKIVIKLNSKNKNSIDFTVLSWDFIHPDNLSKELRMLYKKYNT